MRCETCHGRGLIERAGPPPSIGPCPRCGGTGFDHCCDGANASCELDAVEQLALESGSDPMDAVNLRPARPDESEALTALMIASKASHGYDDAFMSLHAHVLVITEEDINGNRVIVAEREGRLLGFSQLSHSEDPDTRQLDDLFVHPDAQGQGIGRLLWDDGCAHARSEGATHLRLESDPNAEPFYRRLGAAVTHHTESTLIPGRRLPHMRFDLTPSKTNP